MYVNIIIREKNTSLKIDVTLRVSLRISFSVIISFRLLSVWMINHISKMQMVLAP